MLAYTTIFMHYRRSVNKRTARIFFESTEDNGVVHEGVTLTSDSAGEETTGQGKHRDEK